MATPPVDPQVDQPSPGWYGDPSGLYELRWWTGLGWSSHARMGKAQFYAPLPSRGIGDDPAERAADELAHLEYLEHFLDQAGTDGAINSAAHRILKTRMAARRDHLAALLLAARAATAAGRSTGVQGTYASPVPEGSQAPALPAHVPGATPVPLMPLLAVPAVPSTGPGTPQAGPAMPQVGPLMGDAGQAPPGAEPAEPPQPSRQEPGVARQWFQRTGETVRSDLAINGLSYLGVLLLFTGLFGLVAFSFSSVQVALRPVAEVVVPAAVFGSGSLVGRRNLVVPARALNLLGGLLVLVAVLAAFADKAPVPPDLTGIPLVATLTTGPAAVAAAYLLWSRRRASSPLRHLIAPALWLAVAMAALGWRHPIPFGQDIVIPRPGQYAAVLVAITITLAASRPWPGRPRPVALFPAALAGLGVAAVLAAISAGSAGWPPAPVATSGAAIVIALDLSDRHARVGPLVALQGLVIALTACALVPGLGVGWAGAGATVAGLVVTERALRRATPGSLVLVPASVSVAGLVMAGVSAGLAAPAKSGLALLVASAVTSAWVQARRIWPDGWPYPAWLLTATAAIAPAGVLAGLLTTLPLGVGAAVAGLVLLAGAVLVRTLARQQDSFWAWWIPGAAVTVLAVTSGHGGTAWLAVASAGAAGAMAVSPVAPALRIWLAGSASVWTAWLVFDAADAGFDARLLCLAGAATVAVGFTALWRDAWAGHVGVLGHLVGFGCLPFAVTHAGSVNAATPTALLGLAAVGAIITTTAQEAGRGAVADLLARCGARLSRNLDDRVQARIEAALRLVPAVAAALLMMAFAFDVAALAGLRVRVAWRPLALTALAMGYLLLARALRAWHRVARALADVGAGATVLAAILCTQRGPALAALAAVMVAPVLADSALRRQVETWAAWAASVPAAVLTAELAGLPSARWPAVTLGWGATLLLGSLGVVRMDGRRAAGVGSWWRLPPAVIGVAASAAGLAGGAGGSAQQAGWLLVTAGAVTVVAAVLLRAGALGGAGVAMTVAGLVAVWPEGIAARPWLLLAVAAVLLVGADVTRARSAPDLSGWRRWDLPLFTVAHCAAVVAMAWSVISGASTAVTVVGGGALAAAVAARLRRWPWAVAGITLILAGAGDAGPGWECLAFAAAAAAATALAIGQSGWSRPTLQLAGSLAAVAAWVAGLIWRDASLAGAVAASASAAAAVVLIAAVAARIVAAAKDWARAWGGTAIAVTAAAVIALADPAVPSGTGRAVAAALAVTAFGTGLAAGPLGVGWLRDLAAIAAIASGLVLGYGTSAGLTALAWGAIAAGLVTAGFALAPWIRRSWLAWVRPAMLGSVAATLTALVVGVLALPDRALIVPALVLAAVLIAALAAWLHRPGLAAVTPVPLCAAWLAYASAALTGQPQWLTVPVGVAIIGVAGLLRVARRREGRPVATPDVIGLEITGMAMVMGASLVQTVTDGPLFGLIGISLGIGLTCWGAFTRVRRRLLGGASAVAASLLLVVAVPLARVAPHAGGVATWLSVAGAGLVAIAVAAALDASRTVVRRGVARLADLTRGWE